MSTVTHWISWPLTKRARRSSSPRLKIPTPCESSSSRKKRLRNWRYKDHFQFVVARMPGCDRFTYRLVSRKNLEPVCRIRVERQAQDILFSDAVWWARDEEVVSATEFFSAGGKRITLKGLIIES